MRGGRSENGNEESEKSFDQIIQYLRRLNARGSNNVERQAQPLVHGSDVERRRASKRQRPALQGRLGLRSNSPTTEWNKTFTKNFEDHNCSG
jgi:hypothetical protein